MRSRVFPRASLVACVSGLAVWLVTMVVLPPPAVVGVVL